MFGGNPDQLEQMMKQMGIDFEEIDAEQVVITTSDGEELVFDDVSVNQMSGQGQEVYQVMGSPTTRPSTGTTDTTTDTTTETTEAETETTEESTGVEITEDDVELVALRAGVDEDAAREALEETDGDLVEAIDHLE